MRYLKVQFLMFVALQLTNGTDSYGAVDTAELSRQSAQTIASLFTFTIQDYFIASRWNRSGTANVVEYRAMVPFTAWGQKNLTRINIPFRTESELGPGLSDVRLFDLLMFEGSSGSWGIGPILNLGINKGPRVDTFQVGPAATFVITSIKSFAIGLLNQNLFSDQFAFTTLQPILVYQLNKAWTIGLGELPLVYDWNKEQFSVFSLGLQVGLMLKIAEQPVRFFANPQFNTKDNTKLYHWTIAFGMMLPLTSVMP